MLNQNNPKTLNKYPQSFSFEDSFFNSNETYTHPSSIIGKNVELGKNVKIGPFCSIVGNVKIKENTIIYPNVSIGFPAQNIGTNKYLGEIIIGKNCHIREFATIGASKFENGKTLIGDNCYIMSYTHVAHDVVLEENVTLINNVNLAGHVHVEKNAILMANSAVHQFCRIGKYTALVPFSATRQDLPPFCIFDKIPAKFTGVHLICLKRAGFKTETIESIKKITKLFYLDKLLLPQIKKIIKNDPWSKNKSVQEFINFIENSKRGVSKKTTVMQK